MRYAEVHRPVRDFCWHPGCQETHSATHQQRGFIRFSSIEQVESLPAWSRRAAVLRRLMEAGHSVIEIYEFEGHPIEAVAGWPVVSDHYRTPACGQGEIFHPTNAQIGTIFDGIGTLLHVGLRDGGPREFALQALYIAPIQQVRVTVKEISDET